MSPEEKKNVADVFAGHISNNRCQFDSIIYTSEVCIKGGLNYLPACCVFLCRKKDAKAGIERIWLQTLPSCNFKFLEQ